MTKVIDDMALKKLEPCKTKKPPNITFGGKAYKNTLEVLYSLRLKRVFKINLDSHGSGTLKKPPPL